MTWLKLIGTHLHRASNIVDFDGAVQAAASGAAASGGVFLPPGGAIGQALLKNSGVDGAASWHDIEDMATSEFDGSLVLAPDGAGGVEFRAEAGGSAYDTVEDEGTPLTQRTTLNFVGAGVSAADTAGVTTVTIAGGGGLTAVRTYISFGSNLSGQSVTP